MWVVAFGEKARESGRARRNAPTGFPHKKRNTKKYLLKIKIRREHEQTHANNIRSYLLDFFGVDVADIRRRRRGVLAE